MWGKRLATAFLTLQAVTLLGIALSATRPAAAAPASALVPKGSIWRYLDDGSNQGSAWRAPVFDDSLWASGNAQLGYGDGDEATTVSYGPDPASKHITTYFRCSFDVPDPSIFQRLKLSMLKDDGAVVFLNGTEVFRMNMPSGSVSYLTLATLGVGGASETTFFNAGLSSSLLITGTNVIAVEVHQNSGSSSDLSFDLELSSIPDFSVATAPKNVILFIGDGMGPEHVRAAGMYANGSPGTLFMETFPFSSTVSTYSADNDITDSAASATSMATGVKVNNGVISQMIPGSGSDLETLGELFHTYCKRLGLVTTTYVTHATPAAFGAHEPSRNNLNQIANDFLTQSKPNVLFGGGGNGMNPSSAMAAGYVMVTNRNQMIAAIGAADRLVSGQFGNTHLPYEYDYYVGSDNGYDSLPHLTEMVTATLQLLSPEPEGFFLMVEGGRIDHAGHSNQIARNVFEILEFDRAIQAAHAWASSRSDTLIVVAADHETGGMAITANNGVGSFPSVTWAISGHAAVNITAYAWGHNAGLLQGVVNNSDLHLMLSAGLSGQTTCTPTAVGLRSVSASSKDIGAADRAAFVILALATGSLLFGTRRSRPRKSSS